MNKKQQIEDFAYNALLIENKNANEVKQSLILQGFEPQLVSEIVDKLNRQMNLPLIEGAKHDLYISGIALVAEIIICIVIYTTGHGLSFSLAALGLTVYGAYKFYKAWKIYNSL